MQHLERDSTLELRVMGLEHDTHATGTQRANDLEATDAFGNALGAPVCGFGICGGARAGDRYGGVERLDWDAGRSVDPGQFRDQLAARGAAIEMGFDELELIGRQSAHGRRLEDRGVGAGRAGLHPPTVAS
jgi:hypothetical protein